MHRQISCPIIFGRTHGHSSHKNRVRRKLRKQNRQLRLLYQGSHESKLSRNKRDTHLLSSEDGERSSFKQIDHNYKGLLLIKNIP